MDRSCDRLLEAVRERANSGKEESVGNLFKPLTMDYISGASFGIQTSFQEEKNHPLFLMAKKVLPGTMTGPFHMIARKGRLLLRSRCRSSAGLERRITG